MLTHTSSTLLRSVVAAAGCATAAAAIVLIWALRGQVDRAVYVSELGADGEPTAALFEVALLLVVLGGACVAWAGRGVRSSVRLLGAWTVSTSIGVAAALFLVASQVPCTAGCPLPVGPSATLQDAIHTSSAVLAFAAACVAMLQASFAAGHRALRVLSMSCGLFVALVGRRGRRSSPCCASPRRSAGCSTSSPPRSRSAGSSCSAGRRSLAQAGPRPRSWPRGPAAPPRRRLRRVVVMPARRPPAAGDVPVGATADVRLDVRSDLPEAPRPPGALRALLRRHPLAVDVLVAVAYVVVSAFGLASTYLATGDGRPLGVDVALAVCLGASAAALLVRRRRPRAAFVVIGLATVTSTVVDSGLDPLGVSLALYALAVHRSDRSAWIGLGVSVLGGGLAVALSGVLHGDGTRSGVALLSPVFVLVTLVAVLVGVTVGGRRRYVAALVDRAERLAREQQQREQLAAAAERARIDPRGARHRGARHLRHGVPRRRRGRHRRQGPASLP